MAINLVQNVGARSSGASIVIPFGSANNAGDLLTLALCAGSTAAGASTVTDSAGNLWLRAAAVQAPALATQQWYAQNAAGSTNTVTVTSGFPTGALQCSLQEWSGISTASALVATSTNTEATQSTHTAGPVSPSASSALFLVTYGFSNVFSISVPPSGYTAVDSTFANMQSFYLAQSGSTTTENPQAGTAATEVSANAISAFSAVDAGAAAGTAPRRGTISLLGMGRV